jgi:hypothetical protein
MVVGFPGFYAKTLIWHDGHLEFPITFLSNLRMVPKMTYKYIRERAIF